MKIYIAGKITDYPGYKREFEEAEKQLTGHGHIVLNPARLNPGFEHGEYMHICFAMLDVCDAIYLLDNHVDSKGALMELDQAKRLGKIIIYERAAMNYAV